MHTAPAVNRSGLTLLEVMVALVILGLVGAGFLQAFAGALRVTAQTRDWAQALVYAELGQERLKIGDSESQGDGQLGGGFTRRTEVRAWRPGIDRATVTVELPDGRRFQLDRLVPAQR